MARANRLKDLSGELRRLFEQNVSVEDAYNQVKDDSRFDAVRLAKVSTIYNQFRAEKGKKVSQLAAIVKRSEQFMYRRLTLDVDRTDSYYMTFWNGSSSDGRFFISRDWEVEDNDAKIYILKDVFTNNTCRIRVPVTPAAEQDYLLPLTQDTGLLVERMDQGNGRTFSKCLLSLTKLDWAEKEVRKVYTLTIENQQHGFSSNLIKIDAMDPTRFVLCSSHAGGLVTLNIGHIRNNEILLEEDILPTNYNFHDLSVVSFVENTMYSLRYSDFIDYWELVQQNEVAHVYVTQLDQATRTPRTSMIVLDSMPEKLLTANGEPYVVGCISMKRFYFAIQYKKTKHYGIVSASLETREWKSVDFCSKDRITDIKFMVNGHFLWIQTAERKKKMTSDDYKVHEAFYRIPLKTPEKLSDLAWFSLVRSKSKLKGVNPYEESQKYLPYYSEIRAPFEE